MKLAILSLLAGLGLAACQHETTPVPTPLPTTPVLTETIKTSPFLSFDGIDLTFRTGKSQAYALSGFGSAALDSITEVGFCLSDSDTLLSILDANQQRVKVNPSALINSSLFWTELPALQAGKRYYIDAYAIFRSGRVYYGRNNAGAFVSKNRHIGVSSFTVPATDTTTYNPMQVVNKATLPTGFDSYFSALFSINNTLYVLNPTGALFAYDAIADQWVHKQDVKARVSGVDMTPHFNGLPPVAFAANGKEYVHFTSGNSEMVNNLWVYDPTADKWTFLSDHFEVSLPSYPQVFTSSNQTYLYNSSSQKILAFNSSDNTFKPLTPVPTNSIFFVPGATQPVAYYSSSAGINIGLYAINQGSVVDGKLLLPGLINPAPLQHVVTTIGNDVLFGSGLTTLVSSDQNPALTISALSDELVRYSTTANRTTARYSIVTLNDDYWSRQVRPATQNDRNGILFYKTLVAGNHVYVINTYRGALSELVF
ncbi:Kelch repeat-containing protein [Spirosoma migulaei]